MNKSEQEILILPDLIKILKKKGFKYESSFEHVFTRKVKWGGIKISLYFSENGESGNSLFSLSHKEVEDIMLEIGVPYNSWTKQKKGKKLLYTVYDIFTKYKFTRRYVQLGARESQELQNVFSQEDVEEWKNSFIGYIENEGSYFINKYSYIPNILSKMNDMDQSNGLSYFPFLVGRLDHLFRGLIISKICNDPFFSKRLEKVRNEVSKPENSEWLSYFEMLENKLETLEPKYNFSL